VRLKSNGTYQLLVCADHANLQDDIVHAIKNIEILFDDSKEAGLEVNA
jgi:hypothetical protein